MNMKTILACTITLFVLGMSGCSTYLVESTYNTGDMASMDSIYISGITILSENAGNLEQSLVKNCCFSLRKRNYRVSSFMEQSAEAGNFTYHAHISLYTQSHGDILDPDISTTFFFDIKNSRNNVSVAVIRLTSGNCNIHHIEDQAKLAETLAERVEHLVGK